MKKLLTLTFILISFSLSAQKVQKLKRMYTLPGGGNITEWVKNGKYTYEKATPVGKGKNQVVVDEITPQEFTAISVKKGVKKVTKK